MSTKKHSSRVGELQGELKTQEMVDMNQSAPYVLPLGFHWCVLLTEKYSSKLGKRLRSRSTVDINQEAPYITSNIPLGIAVD